MSGLLTCWEAAIRAASPKMSESFILSEMANIRRDYLPKVQTTVAENGQILGFICMLRTEVAALFVHPFDQRMGIGSALLKGQNAQTLEVFEANQQARDFYHKHGFRQTHTRVHEETGHTLCCLASAQA
ncbi:GNAT family N-acetyltransferase [Litoreibacter sp.]|nr:GNAT family N-acetyltransferase [Litoreibacter sp.]